MTNASGNQAMHLGAISLTPNPNKDVFSGHFYSVSGVHLVDTRGHTIDAANARGYLNRLGEIDADASTVTIDNPIE